ncbi:MAG: hypothetical protein ACOCQH_00100 [Halanaerobiales bacterium]
MVTEAITTIMLLAVIVEVVTNGIKSAFPVLKGERSRIVAAAVGIILCLYTNIGILNRFNIEIKYALIDYFITGIIISRGSNAVHDIISIFDKQNTTFI